MDELLRFTAFLTHEKRFSPHTVLAYTADLQQFKNYLSSEYQVEEFNEASHFFIRSWIVSLMESGNDPRTVNRKITALRTFYRFLMRLEIVRVNPMLKIQGPKTKKVLPEYLDENKMFQMLEMPEEEHTFQALRNHLLIDFFYRTGVRRAELINLKVSDVNLYNLTVNVTGKRNKMRLIPITNSFRKDIENYLEKRKVFLDEAGFDSTWFFICNKGNQMYPGFVYRIVREQISTVSTGKKRSPHILRHSFATTMLNHGADINAIKELLGHSSLAATQVYTHNSIEKLREIYKQAFPKA